MALVRERTIPTERLQLVGEVSANFCGQRVSRGQRNGFPRSLISVFLVLFGVITRNIVDDNNCEKDLLYVRLRRWPEQRICLPCFNGG
jgi:hypothetical protein